MASTSGQGGIEGNQLALREACKEKQSESFATTSTLTATQLGKLTFKEPGKLEAIWPVTSVAPTAPTNVTGFSVGYVNQLSAYRATASDADYFVESTTIYNDQAKKTGIGTQHADLTLAHTDIEPGDILTVSLTGVESTGSLELIVMWRRTGNAVGTGAWTMPASLTETTT